MAKENNELDKIVSELRSYMKSQKDMGIHTVFRSQENREKPVEKMKPEKIKEPEAAKEAKELSNDEDIIVIEESVDLFDGSAKTMTLEEIREEIGTVPGVRCMRGGRTLYSEGVTQGKASVRRGRAG